MKSFAVKFVIFFIFGMVGGIFATQIFWPYFVEKPLFYQYKLDSVPAYVIEEKEIIIQENTALKDAIEKVDKTIVGIRAIKAGKVFESTGLIISSDGLIISLSEYVPQDSEITIFWGNEKLPFQVLKRDAQKNLVLIKVRDVNLSTAAFGSMDRIKLGERVFLTGIIFDKAINPIKTVNQGIIKRFNQDYLLTNIFETNNLSGSPLFDIEGNVLGINTIDAKGNVVAMPITGIREFAGM